jgi:uncharacterized repeat protein (TIGR01451 family)
MGWPGRILKGIIRPMPDSCRFPYNTMKNKTTITLAFLFLPALLCCESARAEQHRATWLGNPATRFAPPLTTPEDLRARFRDETLKPDIASILEQWGWKGNVADLHRAALSNEITEVSIPVGTRMPFMSSRHAGKPICLRNVLWAGREPIAAYAFTFSSKGRRYRCVTPKPCSNFFLEDLGAPVLTLACNAPDEVPAGRPVNVCLTLRNTGNAAEPRATVTMPIPDGASYLDPTNGNVASSSRLRWNIPTLAPGASTRLCAAFTMRQPGLMSFAATVRGGQSDTVQSSCSTRVAGIPAILLEVVDLQDPIEVGKEVTYDIKVTNQGSAPGTNIRIVCTLPTSQQFGSGKGTTTVSAQAATITMEPLPALAPKAVASWRVVVKALEAADARFRVQLSSDQFEKPIHEDESTQQY